MEFQFNEIGRLAAPDDQVAIAVRTLPAGTIIHTDDQTFTLPFTVLQGHRFALHPIAPGEKLRSWGQPFGVALRAINPGDTVCNENVLRELGRRALDFPLPAKPNFADQIAPFVFDEAGFVPAPAREYYTEQLTFDGYPRGGGRGAGTRNTIVLLGTSSLVNGFVRALEARLKPLLAQYPNIDSIVAVAHTEGGHAQPNNRELLLRTLAGFMVNPNVGAVLAVDYGSEAITNEMLYAYHQEHNYPLDDVLHDFMSLSGSFQQSLDTAAQIVEKWLEPVNSMKREPVPVSALKIGLQCGGSDAFSGISGNPLCGWVTQELIRYGGSANIAETDELIGAESYMLSRVRDLATAQKFAAMVDRFKTWAGWHGQSAEGNPSGGNLYRGLYNIYLKSLGAAIKRHPETTLDAVIEYGEPMREPGFYFMDSPGNDLESIAGQVASGCNVIFFTTGNGSITNFPFVPTIKIVTTTERYELLSAEMDVNAGQYLDGVPLEQVGQATVELTLAVASGQLSAGERAGHTQVQIWRDWRQTAPITLMPAPAPQASGIPVSIATDVDIPEVQFTAIRTADGVVSDQIGLILPTSLCSGQIARMSANHLNEQQAAGLARFVALVHTEGCGSSTVSELVDNLLGYLAHPLIKYAVLLEHGCEKTHNSYIRHTMLERGLDPQGYGWASVQLDGGIQKVLHKIENWFNEQPVFQPEYVQVGLEAVRTGLVTHGTISDEAARQLALLTQIIVAGGGTVVIPENDAVLQNSAYLATLSLEQHPQPTLALAQAFKQSGLHIMANTATQWSETLTSLGATGVEVILSHVDEHPLSGHPLLPVLQVTSNAAALAYQHDFDAVLTGSDGARQMLDLLVRTLGREYRPRLNVMGNTDFQITRGLMGVSL